MQKQKLFLSLCVRIPRQLDLIAVHQGHIQESWKVMQSRSSMVRICIVPNSVISAGKLSNSLISPS